MSKSFHIYKQFSENDLLKGVYIAVIHAARIPPHIGLIIDAGIIYRTTIQRLVAVITFFPERIFFDKQQLDDSLV